MTTTRYGAAAALALGLLAGPASASDLIRLGGPSPYDPPADTSDLKLRAGEDADTQPVYGYRGFGYRGFGGYRGFYGGYRPFYGYRGFGWGGYRGFGYRPFYGFNNFGYRSFYGFNNFGYRPFYGFNNFGYRPFFGGYNFGYRPFIGYNSFYSPFNYGFGFPRYSYYSYSYSPWLCSLGGSIGTAPAVTLPYQQPQVAQSYPDAGSTLPQPRAYQDPALTMPPASGGPPQPAPGTFPYDGGPRAPVPMPGEGQADQSVPSAYPPIVPQPLIPMEGIPVSLPAKAKTPAKKPAYPAYGEDREPRPQPAPAPTVLTRVSAR